MLNQIVLVGRLTKEPELQKSDNNKLFMLMTLAIPRSFKNAEGVYETDFIDCVLWDGVAKSTSSYCHKGDIVGVKGRVQSRIVTKEDGTKKYYTDIIAERVNFLSSKSNADSSKVAN